MKTFIQIILVIASIAGCGYANAQSNAKEESLDFSEFLCDTPNTDSIFQYHLLLTESDVLTNSVGELITRSLPAGKYSAGQGCKADISNLKSIAKGLKPITPVIYLEYDDNGIALQYFKNSKRDKNIIAVTMNSDGKCRFINPDLSSLAFSGYEGEYDYYDDSMNDLVRLLMLYSLMQDDEPAEDWWEEDGESPDTENVETTPFWR